MEQRATKGEDNLQIGGIVNRQTNRLRQARSDSRYLGEGQLRKHA